MKPDRDHLHHRLLALGLSQRRVAVMLYAMNIALVAVALLLAGLQNRAVGVFLLAVVAWAYVMFRHLSRIEVWETGRLLVKGFIRPKGRPLVMALYGVWDLFAIAASWALVHKLTGLSGGRLGWLQAVAAMAGPMVLLLLAGRIYERIWSRARLREYVLLGLLVVAGAICGTALQILVGGADNAVSLEQLALFTPLAGLAIVGVRVFWRMTQEFLGEMDAARILRAGRAERVLAYGAGGRFQLFLREHLLRVGASDAARLIVGVMDDDPNLRGCRVSGIPVLGDGAALSEAIRRHRISCVMITADLPDEKKRQIVSLVRAMGVAVKEWRCDEVELG